jgi:hypothetical protein
MNFESPKSDNVALNLSSRRMFSGFTSRCTIQSQHSLCKYASPLIRSRYLSAFSAAS